MGVVQSQIITTTTTTKHKSEEHQKQQHLRRYHTTANSVYPIYVSYMIQENQNQVKNQEHNRHNIISFLTIES
jgi:hypothetical protein